MRPYSVLIASLFAPQVLAQAPTREEIATLDRELPGLLTKFHVPGLGAAIIRNGRVVWTGGYGLQGPDTPVTDSTLFNVASMTKPVSAEIILRLAAAEMVNGGSGRFAVSDALDLLDQHSPIKGFADVHRSPVAVWLRALLEAACANSLPGQKKQSD